eukprot:362182-Chlamydomonas_euryale.AAC.6
MSKVHAAVPANAERPFLERRGLRVMHMLHYSPLPRKAAPLPRSSHGSHRLYHTGSCRRRGGTGGKGGGRLPARLPPYTHTYTLLTRTSPAPARAPLQRRQHAQTGRCWSARWACLAQSWAHCSTVSTREPACRYSPAMLCQADIRTEEC